MVRRAFIALLLLVLPLLSVAQEVLLPLQRVSRPMPTLTKEQHAAVRLPFFDDFATGAVSPAWWQLGGATACFDVSPLAPTVGVVTLDALNAEGELYPQAGSALFPADTLLSLPLRLDSLTPADSVVLSFFYLPGGGYGNMWERVGESPDVQDSLFLDFFRPSDSVWVTVWSRNGVSVDTLMARTGTAWQYVVLPLTDAAYFDSAFRFRFRNYASLESTPKAGKAGNGDFWHLDCIMIDRGRDSAAGAAQRDVAFAAPAPSLLQYYRAMPYRHYTPAALAANLDIKIINRYTSPLATQYSYAVVDTLGTELDRYEGGFENAPPQTIQTHQPHCHPPVSVTLPAMTGPTLYNVVHVVREGTGGDAFPLNDTVRFRQFFGDHYAYDDGTPENGYGLTSTASHLYLAYRFDLYAADTLTAVDLWFNPTFGDANAVIPFYLTVWSVGDDGRPSEVLYRDGSRRMPRCGGFARYMLESPLPVDGSLFVGLEQSGNDYINLGFDRSLNTADRIWYLTGTEWQQSILSGSLMLRPAFGVEATVGIVPPHEEVQLRLYPNPAAGHLNVEGVPQGSLLRLYDMQGRQVIESRTVSSSGSIDVERLPNGLYLLQALTPDGNRHTSKIIIKH